MSQNEAILWYLKEKGPITQWDAIKAFKCTRLGARIYDLKRKGHAIMCENVPNANGKGVHGRYSLVSQAKTG